MVKAKRGGKIKKITQRLPDTIGVPVVACASCEGGGSYQFIYWFIFIFKIKRAG